MPDNNTQSRWGARNQPDPAPSNTGVNSASDAALADLERMMRRRMRSQGGQDRSTVASRRIPGKGVTFPRSEAHRPQGREIILGVDREETFEPAGDDERLPIDLSDQISPVDRVFLSIQSGVRVCLRILVVVLTVLAGAELAYAFNLWAFKGGHIGAILAVAIACFVAARWITKD